MPAGRRWLILSEWLLNFLRGIPLDIRVIILASFPVTELRFSIPAAVAMGVPPAKAYILSLIGNIIPAWLLLLVLGPAFSFLAQFPPAAKLIHAVLSKTRNKGDKVEKYGTLGLMLFVAVPAPGTGVWTGSLLAYLFGIPFSRALPAMAAGTAAAGVIVTAATVGFLNIVNRGSGPIILLIAFGLLVLFFIHRRGRAER